MATDPSENETLGDSPTSATRSRARNTRTMGPPATPSRSSQLSEGGLLSLEVTQPDGSIVVEMLDTPATRRAKHLRRKSKTSSTRRIGPGQVLALLPSARPSGARPARRADVAKSGDVDMESELSSLSGKDSGGDDDNDDDEADEKEVVADTGNYELLGRR